MADVIVGTKTGNYSDYTQNILNLLPEWHVARRHRDSNAATIVNSAAGIGMQSLNDYEIPNFLSQRIMSLADETVNEFAYTIDVSAQDLGERNTIPNLVKNSVFGVWQNPHNPPDYWRIQCEDEILTEEFNLMGAVVNTNYSGGKSISIRSVADDATTYGLTELFQDIEIEEDNTQNQWTASLWAIKIGNEEILPNFFELYVQPFYRDKDTPAPTVQTIRDESDWHRVTIKLETEINLEKIRIGIRYTPDVGTDLAQIYISSFMLYATHASVFWAKNEEDRPPFLELPQDGRMVQLTAPDISAKTNFYEIEDAEISPSLLPSAASITFSPLEVEEEIVEGGAIRLADAYHSTGERIPVGVVIGSVESAARYGWEPWVYGKLIKFNLIHPDEIIGAYSPSYPIVTGLEEDTDKMITTSSVEMQAMVQKGENLWILSKVKAGSSLRFMRDVPLILSVVDASLPKVLGDTEDIDYLSEIELLPIKYSYFFSGDAQSSSFGVDLYGDEAYGGQTPPTHIRHTSMSFVTANQIETTMEYGYRSRITLKPDYYLDLGSEIALFRDPREDAPNAEIVVW